MKGEYFENIFFIVGSKSQILFRIGSQTRIVTAKEYAGKPVYFAPGFEHLLIPGRKYSMSGWITNIPRRNAEYLTPDEYTFRF